MSDLLGPGEPLPFEPNAITEFLDTLGRVRRRFIPPQYEVICTRDGLMRVVKIDFEDNDAQETEP